MPGGETDSPEDRVRDALAQLRCDPDSAPEVPAAVMNRIHAALRSAPPPPAHAATAGIPPPPRWRLVALVLGIGALAAAAAVGLAAFLHSTPSPRFPSGPTAEMITVSRPPGSVATRP